jgi:hypothetical protein
VVRLRDGGAVSVGGDKHRASRVAIRRFHNGEQLLVGDYDGGLCESAA